MNAAHDLEQLRTQLSGRAFGSEDSEYNRARAAWNKNIDQHPAVIVQPQGPADVASAIRHAARWSLPVAVQSTGHGAILPCDEGVLIDTSALDGVEIDAEREVARVAPGAIWKKVMKAAEPHGLAGRTGFNPTVGVLGYTFGGGWGWLSRQHGMACDHIVAADMVLADGSTIRVDAEREPDLLWALRGGGGNVGVVTSLEFGLVPLHSAYGGSLTFPLERARELMNLFAMSTRNADIRLTTAIRLFRPPSDGLLGKLFGGKPTVSVMLCFLGDEEEGEPLVRRWIDAGPAHGSIGTLKSSELGDIEGPPPKGAKSVQVGEQLSRLNDAAIEALVSRFEPDDAPVFLTELRHVGGVLRERADAACDRRDGEYLLHLEALAPYDEARCAATDWIDGTRRVLEPVLSGASALGFVGDGERGLMASRRGYSNANLERLAAITNRIDPEDRFRFNISTAFR